MARTKFDGVIEAVRYSAEGDIDKVRVYERRWLVFSDGILMSRADLLEEMKSGKIFFTGQRKTTMGNNFSTGKQVHISGNGKEIITTKDQGGSRDFLTNVPVF